MATISQVATVASVGRFIAWLIWLAIHTLYLIGFRQRVTTLALDDQLRRGAGWPNVPSPVSR